MAIRRARSILPLLIGSVLTGLIAVAAQAEARISGRCPAAIRTCETAFAGKATPLRINRKAYFETAFDRLGRVLQFTLESGVELTPGELEMLKELRAFVEKNTQASDFDLHYVAGLKFVTRSRDFDLEDGQPTRTAKTTANQSEPVSINLPLISKPSNDMTLLEVIQLMLHEIGHKAPNKVQTDVDSLAAKVVLALETHYRKIDLGNETALEVLSLPARKVESFAGELSRPGLIVLLKHSRGVIDISEQIIDAVRPSATVILKRQFWGQKPDYSEDPFRILNQFVWRNEFVHSKSGANLMTVRATIERESNAVTGLPSLNSVFARRIAQPEADVQDLEIQIRTGDEPAVISATRRLHYPKLERNSEIAFETEWKTDRSLEVVAKGLGELKVRGLLVRTDDSEFEVAAEKASLNEPAAGKVAGTAKFILELPESTNQRSIRASSVILEDGTRVPGANVVKIDFKDNLETAPATEKVILKASLKTKRGWRPLFDSHSSANTKLEKSERELPRPKVNPGRNQIELFVKSDRKLKEIRIRVEHTLNQFDMDAFPHQMEMQPFPGSSRRSFMPNLESPRYRTDVVHWIVLREGEFKQSRRHGIVHIVADIDLAIQHRTYTHAASFQQSLGGGRRFSNRVLFDRHVGWDYGYRTVTGVELTDSSLRTSLIQAPEGLEFTIENGAIDTDA